jgi:hopanoid biosynthesis associated radical SAM protein HpnH
VFDRAIAAIKLLRERRFRVNVNATLFDGVAPPRVAAFLDYASNELDVEGITVSPGYAYERAPDQEHFLNRRKTKQLFRDIFKRDPARRWRLNHSSLYLDFLAGNQEYHCTPWGNPTRNIFGWQRPCYLLGEGYASSFNDLMETTAWGTYGTGNYEKCADCMAHCGYEATAVSDAVKHPLKALRVALGRFRTDGQMAPEISLEHQRPAERVFEELVEQASTAPVGGSGKAEAGRERSHAA